MPAAHVGPCSGLMSSRFEAFGIVLISVIELPISTTQITQHLILGC